METTNIVVIFIFILPGILAERISYLFDYPIKEKHSDFDEIINGIMLSLPIVFFSALIAWILNDFNTLQEFINTFNDLIFLFTFTILIAIIAVLFGIGKGLNRDRNYILINKIRGKLGKMNISNKTCYNRFFFDKNEIRFLEIIYEGESNKGFAADYSTPGEGNSMTLCIDKMLYNYSNFDVEKLFTKVIGVYTDFDKKVVIKDYDMSDFNDWYKENCSDITSEEELSGEVVEQN